MKFAPVALIVLMIVGFLFVFVPRYLPELRDSEPTPVAPASEVIAAISGQSLELENGTFQIERLTCPDPETEEGIAAQKALSDILAQGDVSCLELNPTTARCFAKDANLTDLMRDTGLCAKD